MYLIQNGTVHTGDGRILTNHDILVEGTQIRKIGQNLEAEGAEIIEASGCEVFPGFIDPNTAIGAMGIPGRYLDNNERTNPITPEMNLKYSIDPDEVDRQEFYKSGVTAIGCAPGNSNVMGGQIAVCKTAHQKMSMRLIKERAALKCSVTSDVKCTYGDNNQLPKTKMGIFHLLGENLRASRAADPDKRDLKQRTICEVFDENKMPVFIAAETKMEIDGVMHLMKDENVELILVDGFCFGESLNVLKEKKVGLILGNLNNCSQIAKHGMDMSRLKELNDNGNLIAFTNTCGGASEGREVFIWTAIEAYRGGVEAEDVVKMMCLNPARMLGVEDRIGTLEEGKDADISVFTAHPVTSYAAKVKHSIINGEVIF